MELDRAFQFALVLGWEDLLKITKPCALRLEYQKEAAISLDHLSVWELRKALELGRHSLETKTEGDQT